MYKTKSLEINQGASKERYIEKYTLLQASVTIHNSIINESKNKFILKYFKKGYDSEKIKLYSNSIPSEGMSFT